jgi:parallel beta-helix repeat protein
MRLFAAVLILMTLGASSVLRGQVSEDKGAAFDTTPLTQYPWKATMPRDLGKDELTTADWVGPDGIIYPNWSWGGVHIGEPGSRKTGIPTIDKIAAKLPESLAGKENGEAFTAALVEAVEQCGQAGGGVIQIPAGTYVLTRPILIRHSRVVLRGAGRGKSAEVGGRDDAQETRILFDFAYGVDGEPAVKVLSFPHHERITRDSRVCFYAQAFSPKASFSAQQAGGKQSHINRFEVTIRVDGKPPIRFGFARDAKQGGPYDIVEQFSPHGPVTAGSIAGEKLAPLVAGAERVSFETKVVWSWKEGSKPDSPTIEDEAVSAPVSFSCSDFDDVLPPGLKGMTDWANTTAISFVGDRQTHKGDRAGLVRDGRRGDTALEVSFESLAAADAAGFKPGMAMRMFTYSSTPFANAIERDGGGATDRDQDFTIKALRLSQQGTVIVEVEQPLQLDFPVNEGQVDTWDPKLGRYVRTGNQSSFVSVYLPVQECGVENIVFEQARRIWFDGIHMSSAMNCWMKNVRVERAGRNPASIAGLMNEIRDCEFVDPVWSNNTGGGSGYFSSSTLLLVDNIYTRNCRHSPNFTGTGSVVRNSRFFSSDAQWHMGWGRGHLMENCEVDALSGTGSYGFGVFAQRNIADIHGPGMGPRNCLYNNDVSGNDGGIFLGGKSENPLVLHNRVRSWKGPGLVLRYHVFNGIFLGNVFAVQNRFEPAVLFGDHDVENSRLAKPADGPKPKTHKGLGAANPGNDFLSNTVYGGNGKLADGNYRLGHTRSVWRRSAGNRVLPWEANPSRPQPAMASVFETQRSNPEGFADRLSTGRPIYPGKGAADDETRARNEGRPVLQVNFGEPRSGQKDDPMEWHGETPGKNWHIDAGGPFADQAKGETKNGVRFGWVGGRPAMHHEADWSDPDVRYRTIAHWGETAGEDLRPFGEWDKNRDMSWQVELEPGRYNVFLAVGSPRKPERFTWPDERPLPFVQVNDFLLNGTALKDPRQSDVRRDAYWATVEVGPDRRLILKPAPLAITPRVAFIQIYRDKAKP